MMNRLVERGVGCLVRASVCTALAVLLILAHVPAHLPAPGASSPQVAWAASSTQYLHAAHITVGSQVFDTVNTNSVAGTLAELSASFGNEAAVATLADATNMTIFASNAVPANTQWDLGGTWSVNVYMKASGSASIGSRVFSIYRIDPFGNAFRLFQGQNNTSASVGTSYSLFPWNVSVPTGTTVGTGDRFGIEFAAGMSQAVTLYLGFDTTSQNSRVTAQITTGTPPASAKEAHYRIGQDTPLNAMQWYGATDTQTPGTLRAVNFRVRFQVYNNGSSSKSWTPRLEWTTGANAWAVVPTSSGSAPFFVAATSQFANGASIPTANFGLGAGIGTAQNGMAYDTQNPGNAFTLSANSYTEVEFNVQANSNAAYYVAYLFRLTDNGVALGSYNSDAQLSVSESQNYNAPHVITSSTPDNCATCHRTHTAPGPELRKLYNDKQFCMSCHDGTGTRLSLSTEFNTYTYHHPIEATQGVHREGEGWNPNWNPSASRHVQCMDCHNPHKARTGASTPGFGDLPNNIAGDWGVSPSNPTTAWAAVPSSSYSRLDPVTSEYQVCLKCHSSYAYGTSPPTSHSGGIVETDEAKEFNVNNPSYHYVEQDKTAASGYTPRASEPARMMSFPPGSGYTKTTKMNCTDCHSSGVQGDPRGAHGSTNAYLLRGTWNPSTSNQYGLCLQCHDQTYYDRTGDQNTAGKTGFSGEKPNLHTFHMSKGSSEVPGCYTCHSSVPHGAQYRALLAPRRLPDGTQPAQDSYNSSSKLWLNSWASSGAWTQNNCGIYPGGGH